MATNVILPALGMVQETGKVVRWLKTEGEQVIKGEPLAEIETDKATVELEAPASGVLANVTAASDEDIPVGQVIAMIVAPGESPPHGAINRGPTTPAKSRPYESMPAEPPGALERTSTDGHEAPPTGAGRTRGIAAASPKARRLAGEQGKDITVIKGSGPEGAVLAADVLAAVQPLQSPIHVEAGTSPPREDAAAIVAGSGRPQGVPLHFAALANEGTAAIVTGELTLSNTWRVMAERTTQSWTSVPHFYLVREVNAGRLLAWREQSLRRSAAKITYTDLLVKIVAAALRMHPRLNASWSEGKVTLKQEIHVGLAVAVEEGLVVPVIHQADRLSLGELARQREELVTKAHAGKLRPQDVSGGTFTISNLGMYGVDAFNAIIHQPQVAILAVGRIAGRVVPVNGQPAVQPMMLLTLSCDHRAVDGARGAQFLDTVAALIEEPLGLLD
jgi:pyruvate dehydrogenase E2 component (dihydrolipoamide acetyltransferase)